MSAAAQRMAPVPTTLTGWALLNIDGITLALPQKDVVTIELVSALEIIQNKGDAGKEMGWLTQGSHRWPVYCLDRRLAVTPMLTKTPRVCVLVHSDERTLGLAGAQVSLLASDEELNVQPLPPCLAEKDSPLSGLALYRDSMVMCVHVAALVNYLSLKENTYVH